MSIVCIVGFDQSHSTIDDDLTAAAEIQNILERYNHKSDTIISGESPKFGVDIFTKIAAHEASFKFKGYPPTPNHRHWLCDDPNCYGYKNRNLDMAKDCTELYCIAYIREQHTCWNGGMWTMQEVEKLGKLAHLVIV